MRLPSFKQDYWCLGSGEERHEQHPDTFWIPAVEQRAGLQRGQAAKLMFEIEGQEEDGTLSVQVERMWVIVAEKVGDTYIGILDNQPASTEPADDVYLKFGAEIPFQAEHVIDIGHPPAEYVEWQLGQPPERVWPREEV